MNFAEVVRTDDRMRKRLINAAPMLLPPSMHPRFRKVRLRGRYLAGRLSKAVSSADSSASSDGLPRPAGSLGWDALPPDTKEALAARVEEILSHRFDLLGSGLVDCSTEIPERRIDRPHRPATDAYRPIDWHRDFRSGYRWSEHAPPWETLATYRSQVGVDVKWPWELSRCQHLPLLAIAVRAAASAREPEAAAWDTELRNQISDWIGNNSVGVGVNWACHMDAAIRAANWVCAFLLLGRPLNRRDPWQRPFWSAVGAHCRFLFGMLKYAGGKHGNHYAAELAGLYLISQLCPFLRGSRKWRTLTRQGLEQQIRKQVRDDGVHFEESTSYHLLVTEIFLYPLLLGDTLGEPFSAGYRDRVLKMLTAVDELCSSRFCLPRIGDDDNGFFFKPVPFHTTEERVRHLLGLTALAAQSKHAPSVEDLLLRWFLVKRSQQASPLRRSPSQGIRVFEQAGWVVLRNDAFQVNMALAAKSGSSGGGHAHEDELSISVFWDGWPVIVDPGTACYTPFPQQRNRFRYGPFHNQPQPLRPESEYLDRAVFAHLSRPEVRWEAQDAPLQLRAEATDQDRVARRLVSLDGNRPSLEVREHLEGVGRGRIALCLAPGIGIEKNTTGYYILAPENRVLRLESDGINFACRTGPYSPSYGKVCDTSWLVSESAASGLEGRWRLWEA